MGDIVDFDMFERKKDEKVDQDVLDLVDELAFTQAVLAARQEWAAKRRGVPNLGIDLDGRAVIHPSFVRPNRSLGSAALSLDTTPAPEPATDNVVYGRFGQ